MKYLIKGSISGKRKVEFHCPTCNAILVSPLEEAGQPFPCPTCGRKFTTPGVAEYRCQLDDAHAAAVANAKAVARLEDAAQAEAAKQAAISGAAFEAAPASKSRRQAAANCDNCGGMIGKLETRLDWQGNVVCGDCFGRLNKSPPAVSHVAPVQYAAPESTSFSPTRIILVLAVVAGIVLIIMLLGEWAKRNEIIDQVNHRFGGQ
jgi:DNA-directed RNA polymerase subunit M/transcription elongation factor TFIIS